METLRPESGSAEHRRLLARFFMDSHVGYVPESVQWPALSEDERARLIRLPFWQEAVSTENMTSHTVTAAAALESDPELRRAIEMQGLEEQRHARLLVALTSHYRIDVVSPPPIEPRSPENDFLFAGFGECFDSFFAFGLFAVARTSGYFPPALIEVFEPVVQEEARHILFFVNWVKYRRSLLPWWKRPLFGARCAWIILKQVASRARTARQMSAGTPGPSQGAEEGHGPRKGEGERAARGDNFTLSAHQDLGESITLHKLLGLCLSENERRLSPYDERLARPRLVPAIARFLYRVLPARF
jgi:hypothetical protein